jgi:hypothetical protein
LDALLKTFEPSSDSDDGYCRIIAHDHKIWAYCPSQDPNPPDCVFGPRLSKDFDCNGDKRDVYLLPCCPLPACPLPKTEDYGGDFLTMDITVYDANEHTHCARHIERVVLAAVDTDPYSCTPAEAWWGEFECKGNWLLELAKYQDPEDPDNIWYVEYDDCMNAIRAWKAIINPPDDCVAEVVSLGSFVIGDLDYIGCYMPPPGWPCPIAIDPCVTEHPIEIRENHTYHYGVLVTCTNGENLTYLATFYRLKPPECRGTCQNIVPEGADAGASLTLNSVCPGSSMACGSMESICGWGEGSAVPFLHHCFCGCDCQDVDMDGTICGTGLCNGTDFCGGQPELGAVTVEVCISGRGKIEPAAEGC